jgi:hypothetical protein
MNYSLLLIRASTPSRIQGLALLDLISTKWAAENLSFGAK